jgi:predicted nucleotidyltransferase component of viral defense system
MLGKDPYKFIFIHAPKTGGNSIQHALRDYCVDEITEPDNGDWYDNGGTLHNFEVANPIVNYKHGTIKDYYDNWKEDDFGSIDDYFKFSVVRNPWERAISAYFYKYQTVIYAGVEEFIKDKFMKETEIESMSSFFFVDGKISLDYCMKIETIQQGFNEVCDKLNIPRQTLLKLNNAGDVLRKNTSYIEYYDEEMIDHIGNRYIDDVENFGYNFGD